MKQQLQLYKEIQIRLSMEHVTEIHPSIQVTQCASSDRSFEIHLTGTGFPPDTNTMTKIINPDGSSPGSIPFKTDKLGNLRSFFLYSVESSSFDLNSNGNYLYLLFRNIISDCSYLPEKINDIVVNIVRLFY
jgi:hypothetical protein